MLYTSRRMSEQTPFRLQKEFYPQLEALRGLAILFVVLYHYFPTFCPRGYIGVDIFLALSGFLLFKGFYTVGDHFSFFPYIGKKLIRLFPSFLCSALAIVLIGALVIPPDILLPSIKTCLSSIVCISNIYLDSVNSNYFGQDSQTNLFTHTWYLSVTVQAFILLGVCFSLIKKFRYNRQKQLMLALAVLSFTFCFSRPLYKILFPGVADYYLYYSTCARLWEFIFGGSIIFFQQVKVPQIIRYIVTPLSVFLIVAAMINVDLRPLVYPVSIILIYYGVLAQLPSFLFNLKPLQYLGKISFSVYLWHWPLLVLWKYYFEGAPCIWLIATMVFSCCIGAGAYHLIERKKWHYGPCAVLTGVLLGFSSAYLQFPSIQQFIGPNPSLSRSQDAGGEAVFCADYPNEIVHLWKGGMGSLIKGKNNIILIGDKETRPSFVVMGDSHALAFKSGLHTLGKNERLSGYYVPAYVTPFDNRMAARARFQFRKEEADAIIQWLERHPELHTVIIIQRWSIRLKDTLNDESLPLYYDFSAIPEAQLFDQTAHALERFCTRIHDLHKNLILVTEAPPISEGAPYYQAVRNQTTGRPLNQASFTCTEEQYRARFARILALLEQLQAKGLCELAHIENAAFAEGPWYAIKDNHLLMIDDNHLSPYGASLLVERQKQQWLRILRQNISDE